VEESRPAVFVRQAAWRRAHRRLRRL